MLVFASSSIEYWLCHHPNISRSGNVHSSWNADLIVICCQVLISFPEEGSVEVEHNEDLPDYLPEEESPSQDPDKAVTRVGTGQDGVGWLGTAANFLSRSFYW